MRVEKYRDRISPEKIDQIYYMTIAWKTIDYIVRAVGVNHNTVSRRRKMMNIDNADVYS